jgi:hypothetical protein
MYKSVRQNVDHYIGHVGGGITSPSPPPAASPVVSPQVASSSRFSEKTYGKPAVENTIQI